MVNLARFVLLERRALYAFNWYKLLIKTFLAGTKIMFTQRSRDAITVTWKTRHFRRFTSEQNKVSKSEVVEKVIRVADF